MNDRKSTRVTGVVTLADRRVPPGFADGSLSWDVEVHYRGRTMKVPFYTGPALGEPTVEDVLNCLVADAAGVDQAGDFDSWAAEYGYDTDSRKAYATYRAVLAQTEQLRRLLGHDFDSIVYAEGVEV